MIVVNQAAEMYPQVLLEAKSIMFNDQQKQ